MEEVDSEFGLRQEFVPEEHWETRVNTSKDSKKMCFKGVDGLLHHILAVGLWGNKLVSGVPVFFNDMAEFLACFVVQDVAVNGETSFLEAGVDAVVGCDAVFVMTGSEGFHQDDIGHTVVCKHDVLVTNMCLDVEAAHVIGV